MNNKTYRDNIEVVAGNLIQMGTNMIRAGQDLLNKVKRLSITVVTRWCNDSMIAPFFLDHYSFANEIIVLMSNDTTDDSREIIKRYPNARVQEFIYPSGVFNQREANLIIHETVKQVTSDWVIAVDADEFVFVTGFKDIREFLQEVDGNLVIASFWQIYRHKSEMDLDPTLKAIWLRRHGDPNREKGRNALYNKPVVVRTGLDIRWGIGLHAYEPNPLIKVSSQRLDGAHWRMADPLLAINRRMRGRRENIREDDIKALFSNDNFDVTEEEIIKECKAHLNDPQLF